MPGTSWGFWPDKKARNGPATVKNKEALHLYLV